MARLISKEQSDFDQHDPLITDSNATPAVSIQNSLQLASFEGVCVCVCLCGSGFSVHVLIGLMSPQHRIQDMV